MSSESFGLFKTTHSSLVPQARLRWIEWLITVLFIVTLLIGSGIFIEASNAADAKYKNSKPMVLDPKAVIPGTIHKEQPGSHQSRLPALNKSNDMEDDSCELKS